jgi:hypothetical protein
MRVRNSILALAAAVLMVAVSACGSSSSTAGGNGVAAKSPTAILAATTKAFESARTVHVAGSFVDSGVPTSLDLRLVAGKGGTGSMAENGLSFKMIVLDGTLYLNASDAFWKHYAGTAAAQLFHDKWLKAPTSGQFASLAQLLDLQTLFKQLAAAHGAISKGAESTIDGQKAIALQDASKGSKLYVATTGRPYPLAITPGSGQKGELSFDGYDQPVSLTAPAGAIAFPTSGG